MKLSPKTYLKNYYSVDVFKILTEEEYNQLIKILNNNDSALNTIMMSIYDITMEYAYTNITEQGKDTYGYLDNVI